jgi:hypothetical protein
MNDICPNSTSMARTKESLTVDAEDGLRENKPFLLKRFSRMCPVPPQGVMKGLNTSFAAAILRGPPETDRMITNRKKGRFRRVFQMSKVDPTHFKTLDRRPTVLLQATQKQTEAVEEKPLSGVEEPGIDALRGYFGTVGSIIRARSPHRINQSSHSTGQSSRLGSTSSLVDVERGDFESSPFATNLDHYGGMRRHQLFDPPVPYLDDPESDSDVSLSSQPSARKPAIKFGEQDVVHSYHRGTLGKDDMATHERRPPETDQMIAERKEGRSGRVLQMSKVDPTHFKTLDRRPTVLLQATQKQTEAVEEKSLSDVEEPGIDALRGSFGAYGSIIRARSAASARRINQSSHSTGQSSRLGSTSSLVDVERGDFESSPFATNLSYYGGMKRYQLYDPPVPHLDVPESDAISLSSQPSARKPAIKFGEQDVVHSYHRGTLGKDDMAPHERCAAPNGSSPLASPRSLVQPSFLPEGSDGSRQQQQQSPVTTGSGSPPRSGLGLDEPRSTPAGVGVAGGAYRDPFESAPASAAFPAIPCTTSLDDDVEPQRPSRRTYPWANGDGTDDEDSVPPLWREDDEETDATSSPVPLRRIPAPPKGF